MDMKMDTLSPLLPQKRGWGNRKVGNASPNPKLWLDKSASFYKHLTSCFDQIRDGVWLHIWEICTASGESILWEDMARTTWTATARITAAPTTSGVTRTISGYCYQQYNNFKSFSGLAHISSLHNLNWVPCNKHAAINMQACCHVLSSLDLRVL